MPIASVSMPKIDGLFDIVRFCSYCRNPTDNKKDDEKKWVVGNQNVPKCYPVAIRQYGKGISTLAAIK